MKSLIITISAALMIARVHSQSPPSISPANQQSLENSIAKEVATPVGMNATTAANSASGPEVGGGLLSSNSTVEARPGLTIESVATNNTSLVGTSSSLNSTVSRTFVMDEAIHWTHSNFSVFNQNGTVVYQITNQYAGASLTAKEFIVEDAISGEKKLRLDSRVKACGFGQTYKADDNTTFILNTRAFLSDRWYIKDTTSVYTFKRYASSMQGDIFDNERLVAQVTTLTNSTSTSSSKKQLTVTTDGSIRPWDLIALMALAKTRIHTCGY